MPPEHPPGLHPRGLHLRAFAGDADFPAMAEVANAVFAADRMGWVRTPQHMREDYARLPRFDPLRDLVMAECDGRLVGYVRSAHWTDAHGCLGPVNATDGGAKDAYRDAVQGAVSAA